MKHVICFLLLRWFRVFSFLQYIDILACHPTTKMRVSMDHNPQRSDRNAPCVIDMPPTSSSDSQLEEDPQREEVTRSDVEAYVLKDKHSRDGAKSKRKMRSEGDAKMKRHSRSQRSTQTEGVDNSHIPMLSDTEPEEKSTLELLCRIYTTQMEIYTVLMAMEWPLTSLTILLPLIPFLGILWSRFWLTTFNVDWAVYWMLIGVAPLLFNSLRRFGGSDAWVKPSGHWIHLFLVFGFLILISSASFWSQAPGIYARTILSFSVHVWPS